MSILSQEVIDYLEKFSDAREVIISCGVDPEDHSLYIVGLNLEIRKIIPNGKLLPISAIPVDQGSMISLTFHNVDGDYLIDSRIALRESKILQESSKLFVNNTYVCDLDKIESLEHVDVDKTGRP